MTFIEALQELKNGKKIRAKNWLPEAYVYFRENGELVDHLGKPTKFTIDDKFALDIEFEIFRDDLLTKEERNFLIEIIKHYKGTASVVKSKSGNLRITINSVLDFPYEQITEHIDIPLSMGDIKFEKLKVDKIYELEDLGLSFLLERQAYVGGITL